MKFRTLLLLSFFIFAIPVVPIQAQQGLLLLEKGSVKVIGPKRTRLLRKPGAKMILQAADRVQTGKDTSVKIKIKGKPEMIELSSRSFFRMGKITGQTSSISLLTGKARFKIKGKLKKKSKKKRFQIRTVTALVGVRGTDFVVGASNTQTSLLTISGNVSVAPVSMPDIEIEVPANQASSVKQNSTPTSPVKVAPKMRQQILKADSPKAFRIVKFGKAVNPEEVRKQNEKKKKEEEEQQKKEKSKTKEGGPKKEKNEPRGKGKQAGDGPKGEEGEEGPGRKGPRGPGMPGEEGEGEEGEMLGPGGEEGEEGPGRKGPRGPGMPGGEGPEGEGGMMMGPGGEGGMMMGPGGEGGMMMGPGGEGGMMMRPGADTFEPRGTDFRGGENFAAPESFGGDDDFGASFGGDEDFGGSFGGEPGFGGNFGGDTGFSGEFGGDSGFEMYFGDKEGSLGGDSGFEAYFGDEDGSSGKGEFGMSGEPGRKGELGMGGEPGREGELGMGGEPGREGEFGMGGEPGREGEFGMGGEPGRNGEFGMGDGPPPGEFGMGDGPPPPGDFDFGGDQGYGGFKPDSGFGNFDFQDIIDQTGNIFDDIHDTMHDIESSRRVIIEINYN